MECVALMPPPQRHEGKAKSDAQGRKGSLLSASTLLAKSLGNYREIMMLVRRRTQQETRTKGNLCVKFCMNFYLLIETRAYFATLSQTSGSLYPDTRRHYENWICTCIDRRAEP